MRRRKPRFDFVDAAGLKALQACQFSKCVIARVITRVVTHAITKGPAAMAWRAGRWRFAKRKRSGGGRRHKVRGGAGACTAVLSRQTGQGAGCKLICLQGTLRTGCRGTWCQSTERLSTLGLGTLGLSTRDLSAQCWAALFDTPNTFAQPLNDILTLTTLTLGTVTL